MSSQSYKERLACSEFYSALSLPSGQRVESAVSDLLTAVQFKYSGDRTK